MTGERAVLRDEYDAHICVLTDPLQIERLERRAFWGDVIKLRKMRRGRLTTIYRLKKREIAVDPSDSRASECCLTFRDTLANARVVPMSTREAERLIGHGVRMPRAARS